LERRNQIRRRRSGLDLHALDLLARDLLLDRLQEALPVLILVLLGVKLGLRQLADEPIARSWSRILGSAPWSISIRRGLTARDRARGDGASVPTRRAASGAGPWQTWHAVALRAAS
jgi:hypothetical protein